MPGTIIGSIWNTRNSSTLVWCSSLTSILHHILYEGERKIFLIPSPSSLLPYTHPINTCSYTNTEVVAVLDIQVVPWEICFLWLKKGLAKEMECAFWYKLQLYATQNNAIFCTCTKSSDLGQTNFMISHCSGEKLNDWFCKLLKKNYDSSDT